MNSKNNQKGFTIVELLIVIVVIAILAAISIVAYTGIQNRARTSSGQQLASQIAKKMEAYFAIHGSYPTLRSHINGTPESVIDGVAAGTAADTMPIQLHALDTLNYGTPTTGPTTRTAMSSALSNNGQSVTIWGTASGGNVYYWDFTSGTSGAEASIKYGP